MSCRVERKISFGRERAVCDERRHASRVPMKVRYGVRVDQGAAHHRGRRVDGRDALSAAAVRLSLRGRTWFEAVRDVQGDGTPAAEGDHQSGDDCDVAGRALPGLGRSLVFRRLVARKIAAGSHAVGRPRLFCSLREEFRRRPKSEVTEILSRYQRGTDRPDDRDRYPGSG